MNTTTTTSTEALLTAEQAAYQTTLVKTSRTASYALATLPELKKNALLHSLADLLVEETPAILQANKLDIAQGEKNGLSKALLDRLLLTKERIADLAQSVRDVATLPDPIGEIIEGKTLQNGLSLIKKRVPLGVVLVIYESRPNVTIDIASLCLKSGNAAILRGGKESRHSNLAFAEIIQKALAANHLPPAAVQVVKDSDRKLLQSLLKQKDAIDIVVPRGGEGLVNMVAAESRIPVIYHDKGVCHLYVAADADIQMAIDIAVNAKTQRPGVCNAIETILFHEKFPGTAQVIQALEAQNVSLRGDEALCAQFSSLTPATEEDWGTEYLDLILSAKTVSSTAAAIDWIHRYGSGHSDGILTTNLAEAENFANAVDTACVFINASTRFHDGGCFDMGSEVGISNQKLHVRGPMGIRDLSSYKYIIQGSGQTR